MMAGANDLLWDYTEANIPTTSPDNGLYYSGYVNDAAGTNNGLHGVKLNSSGWAYFEKAAVAGKLKLTFANRKTQTAYAVSVYNATKTGDAPVKGAKIIDTDDIEFGMSATIDLPAEVTGVYIERKTGQEGVLSKIQFTENKARDFENFKLVLIGPISQDELNTTVDQIPNLVSAVGTPNSDQHGFRNLTFKLAVDGPVLVQIGDCQYGNQPISVKNKAGVELAVLNYPAAGCYSDAHEEYTINYIYTGAADTLTFGPIQYCNMIGAEAIEVSPCDIIFKDQNGVELGRVETIEGAALEAIPYTEADLPAIAEGNAFRGWFYSNGKKAAVGDLINGNTTIQAKVTPIETVTVGSVQTYDFASPIFYPEDHETVQVNGGSYYNNHGWLFNVNGSINVQVAGNAVVVVTLCQYSESGDVKVMDSEQELASYAVVKNETPDGTELAAQFTGNAGWLTINWTAKQYIHKVVVYNVNDFPEKDEASGYYIVPAGDAAAFIMTLVQAQEGDKIFLPNGIYDLGETVLTTISKNNIAIIGQSMEGTIIKNAPDAKTESIDKTATIKINKNVQNTYLQDLTIQNALDYYKSDNGRAVALWDQGTMTICKNVRLLSYQDTYYSNLQGAVKYMEDCEIHGTVDYICGDGSVYFKNNLLYCEKRKAAGGGSDCITANNGIASDKGYVFESCVIASECPVVSFGRAWNNAPKVAYLNTIVTYNAGEFVFSDESKIQRWTKELMNPNAWPTFGEYNTHLENGTVLTPATNIVTFIDTKSGNATQDKETVLSAADAATFTMEYTLGEWAATAAADATQAVCDMENIDPAGVYLVEALNGNAEILMGAALMNEIFPEGSGITVRKANARGGFGLKAGEEPSEGVETAKSEELRVKSGKLLRNGRVIIVREGRMYDILGNELVK